MKLIRTRGLLLLFSLPAFWLIPAPFIIAGPSPNYLEIQVFDSTIQIRCEHTALSRVLDEISKNTDIHFQIDTELPTETMDFNCEPLVLERALEKLLKEWNYVIVYDPGNKIQRVIIIGKNEQSQKIDNQSPRTQTNSSQAMEKWKNSESMLIIEDDVPLMEIIDSPGTMVIH